MIKLMAHELTRALAMAAMPARLTNSMIPTLCHVKMETTTAGLVFSSTDRYQLVRTRANYVDGVVPDWGMEEVLIHRNDVKNLLAMLKSHKDSVVMLSAEEGSLRVRVEPTGAQMVFPNEAAALDFPKLNTMFRAHGDASSVAPFGLNPAYVKALTMAAARTGGKNSCLVFSQAEPGARLSAVAWSLGDWAQGLIMPIKLSEEVNSAGLCALMDAAPLPVGSEDPDAAPVDARRLEAAASAR